MRPSLRISAFASKCLEDGKIPSAVLYMCNRQEIYNG